MTALLIIGGLLSGVAVAGVCYLAVASGALAERDYYARKDTPELRAFLNRVETNRARSSQDVGDLSNRRKA